MLQQNHLGHASKPTGNSNSLWLSTCSASRHFNNSVFAPSGTGALLVFKHRMAALTSFVEKSMTVMFRFA